MGTPYLGELRLMSFNFPPRGWAFANGQTLSIAQNSALFALLGTTYGGNGQTTFQLPNMQSRMPVHFGTSGGNVYSIGQFAGTESVALSISEIPQHSHGLVATQSVGATAKPFNHALGAAPNGGVDCGYAAPSSLVALNPASIQPVGNSQAHSNIQPFLAVNMCLALQGVFPSRN